ncbi:ROK family protein [Herbiconiux moechotypicola]|uniref:ROK family protein n=1 Tax=Herbiconiux moechotypicola TaxID=637393 RepID=A0ABP5QYT8_9MICO|nr:ROK family protein [Herbiconiux moechotypicola]MCS5731540.1 ROK family protein [Herbiconiux moechotypicola]
MSSEPCALALDIGGTKLAVGVVDADGTVRSMLVEPTRRTEGPDVIVPRLFDMGRRSITEAGLTVDEVSAVGIACGGPLDSAAGVLLSPLHLPDWSQLPIGALAAAEFGVPATLVNDASAGAWGEFRFGAGRGTRSLIYLTVSTGMGGGAVFNGELHYGAAGNGGEFGHVMVRPGGRLCTCGRLGCVEAYASGTAIAAYASELVATGAPSSLNELDAITAADVSARSTTDPVAGRVWGEGMAALGVAITDLVNVIEPDAVIIGGGLTRSGALLLHPVREAVRTSAMPPAGAAVRVVLSELGDAACLVGAGTVALDRHLAASKGVTVHA